MNTDERIDSLRRQIQKLYKEIDLLHQSKVKNVTISAGYDKRDGENINELEFYIKNGYSIYMIVVDDFASSAHFQLTKD